MAKSTRGAPASAIIPAIIAVARSLNVKVVAEGVETEQELQYLRQQGCDQFQGHYASVVAGRGLSPQGTVP